MAGKIEGKVVAYGESGNLVTDIANERLRAAPGDQTVTITCDEHETVGIYAADHPEEPCTLMAVLGPSGCLEITIVGDQDAFARGLALAEESVALAARSGHPMTELSLARGVGILYATSLLVSV